MSTKLTITIPDELAAELKPWRDRINISKTCAAAIKAEIGILKGLQQTNGDLAHLDWSSLVSRLRAERKGLREVDYQAGYADGLGMAESLSYSGFVHYAEVANRQTTITFLDLLEDEQAHFTDIQQDGTVSDGQAYAQGLVDGLMLVWRKVKDRV